MAVVPSPIGVQRPVTLVLAEIAQVLVPADGIEGRLHRALELLRRIVPCERCALVEVDPSGEPRIHVLPEPSLSETATLAPALLRLLGLVLESGPRSGPPGE